ncbi:ArsR/SmtB family transcription factor [Streptomyces hoynatensis]|uniref:Transcriptional regulator n=1 Tax=Streptomyces hoynatensis TaxID=1141874 RepID=A0A3A9Z2P2_9ACTN|nr:helix-turn-helix domain-containing protein [Streptomyces hoynatensis]RKN41696.1 transcriptional regulator [Streptomyces hoynatensis]
MANEERVRVLDPERDAAALKALTHPLRNRLLGLLRLEGPATATELARRTGQSSAATSYHLRVLARYGFVAEAAHRDGRERRWRSVHDVTSWNNAAMSATPDSRAFLSATRRQQLDELARLQARYEEDVAAGRLAPEWLEVSGISDLFLRLTPESLAELWRTFHDKRRELAARDADDPRARTVVVLRAALPLTPRGEEAQEETGAGGAGACAAGEGE